jgi:hypothetical protein
MTPNKGERVVIRGLVKTAIVAWISEKLFERLTRPKKKAVTPQKAAAHRRSTPTRRSSAKAKAA